MTATETSDYRKLELDSSNDIIRHDARRGDRKYAEAALHIRNAGFGRLRMGEMMSDTGQVAYAAEDWLSAAACFYLVPDLERLREATDRVRKLDHEGKIPPERRDIHAALKEREEQARELDGRMKQFWLDYRRMVGSTRTVMPEALDFLLRKVRELPGSPHLHAEISYQAKNLGQRQLAVESLAWARKFDPNSPHLASLQASQLFAFGDPVRAAAIAREVLTVHPDMDSVRFLLAQALAFRAWPNAADWKATDFEAAIEVLQPLVEQESTGAIERLLATSLAAILQHGLGHEAEYRRLLNSFDRLAEANRPVERNIVTRLRQDLPQVFPQPGSNGASSAAKPDHAALRNIFEQLNSLAGAAAV
jgi:tetratricopeptide (TPR) repeat protein